MKCNKCKIPKCEDCGKKIGCNCQCHLVNYYPWSGTVPCCPCVETSYPLTGTFSNHPGFNL